jgi:predicted MPP superfamily phosphohydrolase
MVLATSLLAALALFVTFFLGVWMSPNGRIGRVLGAVVSAFVAGLAWTLVVTAGSSLGWVHTEEALFHHLYVLGVVGLPLVGAVIVVASFIRPVKDRRARFSGRLVAVIFMVPALIGIYATHIEPVWLRVDRVAIGGGANCDSCEGITIGVVADVQTDAFGSYEARALNAMMLERPDLILVAGDITQVPVDEYVNIQADASMAFSALDAPGGVFVISGNTDPSSDAVDVMALDAGLSPLNDAIVEREVNGRVVRILGIAWPNNRRSKARAMVLDFVATSRPEVVDVILAHSPDVVFNLDEPGSVDLIVSGHTHGGQIQLPGYGPIWNVTELPKEVAAGGLHTVRGVPTYVSTGVGVQRGESPKVRFGVRPSIGVIEIH